MSELFFDDKAVRNTLLNRGIRPESLPPAEDLKKVERRLTSGEKEIPERPGKTGSLMLRVTNHFPDVGKMVFP